jgi:two-component system, NarL family, sensor histidine kinase UhpB
MRFDAVMAALRGSRVPVSAAETPGLYWRVCLVNAAVFAAAAAILVVSPATVSAQVSAREIAVLVVGMVAIIAVNTLLLRGMLTPLDRLMTQIDSLDSEGERLDDRAGGMAGALAHSFNSLQARVEAERAKRAAGVINAQEEERRRIAQELHDGVGQRLTVVLLGLTRALNQHPEHAQEELLLARDHARSGLEEVKRVVHGLRPSVLADLGLGPALEAMAQEVAAYTGLRVETRMDPGLPSLQPATQLALFRVAQEALTNCARHSSAQHVLVTLGVSAETVTLHVVDDGRTIAPGAAGDGLRGMQERATAVDGRLRIETGPGGRGTALELAVPLDKALP